MKTKQLCLSTVASLACKMLPDGFRGPIGACTFDSIL
jgi:hypothetical protein